MFLNSFMAHSLKSISRASHIFTVAATIVGMGILLYSQLELSRYNQAVNSAMNLELLGGQIYGLGLQLGQATRNIVLNPADKKAAENYLKAIEDISSCVKEFRLSLYDGTRVEVESSVKALESALQQDIAVQQQIQASAVSGRIKESMDALAKQETPIWRGCKDMILKLNQTHQTLAAQLKAKAVRQNRVSHEVLWAMAFFLILATIGTAYLNKKTLERGQEAIRSVLAAAEELTSASQQVAVASQSLAEGASQQAASLEETSSSLEEMSSMSKRNSENTTKTNELASQARQAADEAVTDMNDMNRAMDVIKNSSTDIAKIVKTIDEIAFQTNILALNAAVEAARAGESGLGFAVVADEVRNLAQRSAQAARETAEKIEGAITRTEQGVRLSAKVATCLERIVAKVREVDTLFAESAGAAQEQSQGIDQINSAVMQMDKVTQSTAANAEESASAAEELNSQMKTLRQSMADLSALLIGNYSKTEIQS